jgi:hypothetical protein
MCVGACSASAAACVRDPQNLPFSSADGNTKGFYLELAEKLAAGLGRSISPPGSRHKIRPPWRSGGNITAMSKDTSHRSKCIEIVSVNRGRQ